MNRTLNVIRLQLVNKMTYIWIPLIILFGALGITLAIYALVTSNGGTAIMYSGGAQAPLWYFTVVGVQALTLSFPFSQAMSVTRREFYLGTILTAALTAGILSTILVIGGLIELATNGYGINGHFFYIEWMWGAGWWAAWLNYFAIAMFMFVIGFWAATIYKRWGSIAVTLVLVGLGVLFVASLWLVTRLDAWGRVAGWFGDQGPLGLTLWGMLVIAVLAGTSFLTLRRAIP
ncbi:MAG: hypothetical protein ACXWZG_01355 [Microbacterium sp.]